MNQAQIELIQNSFAKVAPTSQEVARTFYGRLFELDPDAKDLFRGDMEEQGYKLMEMLQVVVMSLGTLDAIIPAVQDLAQRHLSYGVTLEQYGTVGEALIWTLDQGLGADFTPETKAAWLDAYGLLVGVIKNSAYPNSQN